MNSGRQSHMYSIELHSNAPIFLSLSLTIRNGIRRVESGEYEEHNNQKVFVVRGFFEHITHDVSVTISHFAFSHQQHSD